MSTPTLTPYLCVAEARAALEWYVAALGAEVVHPPIEMDDGRVGHAELALGEARWMLSAEFPEAGVASPAADRGASVSLHLALADAPAVDALAARVEQAGVPMVRGPEDSERAGRVAVFLDPFGHRWMLTSG